MDKNKSIHAHGKVLLTAEYFVLDGARALALPTRYGQSLQVSKNTSDPNLHWKSIDEKANCWFEAVFHPRTFACLSHNDGHTAKRLQAIFQEIKKRKPGFEADYFSLKTELNFPRNWGLGTSSTLVYLLAKWAAVDSFELQFSTFGGSGYDIACAAADGPVLYKKEKGTVHLEPCKFAPCFADRLFFVYLGKKQNSRDGIAQFNLKKEKSNEQQKLVDHFSNLTDSFLNANDLKTFDELIVEHEKAIAAFIGLPRAKDLYFQDYWGEIKSLGAWGGDFVLATSERPKEETQSYFNERGFEVFISYKNMVL